MEFSFLLAQCLMLIKMIQNCIHLSMTVILNYLEQKIVVVPFIDNRQDAPICVPKKNERKPKKDLKQALKDLIVWSGFFGIFLQDYSI